MSRQTNYNEVVPMYSVESLTHAYCVYHGLFLLLWSFGAFSNPIMACNLSLVGVLVDSIGTGASETLI